ncbi:putative nucleic acid-binding protein [Desulfobotulus alkaliphilus]|uniref:Putative nucleic acid-binding protein n=1 Tax=Desulfobotulus alkaliphilus TaxID=622671 RepID=A0A562QZK6_9BACT|nr:type II toxin-antitoxin system VapC family toxin [Desulfobotulus alkaliphilus]TWI62249.1 putative nucleic acid-binding protein [Desulfobotulus alkaliphilus]
MTNKRYILDANVFLEYIYNRPLQDKAKQIIKDAILEKIQVIVPSLLLDEITEVLCGNMNNMEIIEKHLQYIEKITESEVLNIVVPNTRTRMKAVALARTGNKKSGYPELTDCIYHALAIMNDAVFITNDKRHIAKVKHFGHIVSLSDYPEME